VSVDAAQLRRRNLRTLALLAGLFLVPLLLAFFLYYSSSWRPLGHVNHGALIVPVRPLPKVSLELLGDRDSVQRGTPFGSKWTLVYVGDGACDADCRAALVLMRQTRLSLNNDMGRVTRVFLVTADCCARTELAREHAGLVVANAEGADAAALLAQFPQDRTHSVFIVDPLGNLMMSYDARQNPRGLLEDLKNLLRLSQIG
jgi:hypothetical protein